MTSGSAPITCPFCGLTCDDLTVAEERVDAKGCARAADGYARGDVPVPRHQIDETPVSYEAAVAAAAELLTTARQPMIGGLTADLAGVRAALGLADRIGAIVDSLHSEAGLRNLAVDQSLGRFTATFGEIANRADLVVALGPPPDRRFPRFSERLTAAPGLYRERPPRVRRVGPALGAPDPDVIPVALEDLCDAVTLMVLGATGRPRPRGARPGVEAVSRALLSLGRDLAAASYGVVAWDAATLGEDGDFVIEVAMRLIRALNEETRCVGLPLGGHANAAGVAQASLWQTGWPARLRLSPEGPRHEPWPNRLDRRLADGSIDALVWIAALDTTPPPRGSVPVIALIAPDAPTPPGARVVIRVGVPGIDHPGAVTRGDGIVTLPLVAVAPRAVPSVEDVLMALRLALGPAA